MIDLTGTSAALAKYLNYNKLVWLVIVRADEPEEGEAPQYYGSRTFTLAGQEHTDLIAQLSFEWTELRLKGGVSPVASFALTLRNEGKASQLADTYFLSYDQVEAYLLVVDGAGNDNGDRIPIGRGLITADPYGLSEWSLKIIDGSDRDWVTIPRRKVEPAVGNSFEFAPLESWGMPLPFPFGNQTRGPYDDQGTQVFLAPCVCVDAFTQKHTSGLYNKSYSTVFQNYPTQRQRAQVLNCTQTGPYFTVDSPARLLVLRPSRPKTDTNTVPAWGLTADGKSSSAVVLGSSDILEVYLGGVEKLGSLTDLDLVVTATGSYTYTLKRGGTTLASATVTGNQTVDLSAHLSLWVDSWDFENLLLRITTASTVTVKEVSLPVYFNDLTGIDASRGLEIFQKVEGLADQVSHYVDGGLITGVANTLLANPVDVAQAVLRHKDLLARPIAEINVASFAAARAKRTDWIYAFTLTKLVDHIQWLDPLLQEAGLHLYKNTAGQWTIVARDKSAEPQHFFLSTWNVDVVDAETDYEHWQPDISFARVENRDLENEYVLHAQLDLTSGEYNVLEIASSAYRITGTCSTDPGEELLITPDVDLEAAGVEPGWIFYVDRDQAYRSTGAPTAADRVPIEPVEGTEIRSNASGTTFWAGTNLDPDALRSFRRHKTLNPLGRRGQGFRDIGGYEAQFIGDQTTAQLSIEHRKEWYGDLPSLVTLYAHPGYVDVEPGDTALLHDPWLEASEQALTLPPTLDGAISAEATEMKLTDGEVEYTWSGNYVWLDDDHQHPEVVKITGIDPDTDIATVERGKCNTQAVAHGDGCPIRRLQSRWEVLAAKAPEPGRPRVGVRLLRKPNSHFPPVIIAPDGTPDWPAMSEQQRLLYGGVTHNSGLMSERLPNSGSFIGA